MYYRNAITYWRVISASANEEIESNFIWYNKNVKLGGKTVFNENLFSMGIWTLHDLFDNENHSLIPFNRFRERGATENDRLCWIVQQN